MTQAASQAARFYEEVVSLGRVFTVLDGGDMVVFRVAGQEIVPFWSSAARVSRVQRAHPRYTDYQLDETKLEEFLSITLPQLEREGIHVGVNWSGKRLTGYDVSVPDLVRNLRYWQDRLASPPR